MKCIQIQGYIYIYICKCAHMHPHTHTYIYIYIHDVTYHTRACKCNVPIRISYLISVIGYSSLIRKLADATVTTAECENRCLQCVRHIGIERNHISTPHARVNFPLSSSFLFLIPPSKYYHTFEYFSCDSNHYSPLLVRLTTWRKRRINPRKR